MFDAMYAHAFVYIWVKRWFVVYLRWSYHIASATYSSSWNPQAGQEFHTSHSTRISPVDQIPDYHAFVDSKPWNVDVLGGYSNMDQPFSSIFGLDLSPLCDPRVSTAGSLWLQRSTLHPKFQGSLHAPRSACRRSPETYLILSYPLVSHGRLGFAHHFGAIQNLLGTRWGQVKVPSHSLPPRARQVDRVPWTLLGKQHHSWNNVGWVRLSKAMGDDGRWVETQLVRGASA